VGVGARPESGQSRRERRTRTGRGVQGLARSAFVRIPGAVARRTRGAARRPGGGLPPALGAARPASGRGDMRIATLGNAAVLPARCWVEFFRARGREVQVWSLEPPAPGFDARPLPAAPLPGFLRYPLAVPALARELNRFAPDLIDAHYVPNYGLMGALLGRH